ITISIRRSDAPASALGQPQRGTLLVSQLNQRGQAIRSNTAHPAGTENATPRHPRISLAFFAEKTLL
ncbi:MAG: hypothetical protein Q3X05_12565, partial [Bilophila sp.]|nr:hypothetical protein [Bilophila sp.]